ncbi:methylenetetrahydrofolate reductase [NAD(P)H] [Harryflintia acetispora]|uniref:methylenetetrahydrofolate reductase [NAD(P)H] n=1 Tax=Harryflintia acetispora TaxID=1849041 RepID=UPI0018970F74|nr:methylenetetrahydrofolate reductase [NAD(P)H] [Harryflintia acetispora]
MKLADLFTKRKAVFSLEVFPPKKSGSIETIYDTLEALEGLRPDYISVTYGAGGNLADNSTLEIAQKIKNRYHIEPLAHLTCVNSSREQVQKSLDRLEKAGIENILALRGDMNPELPPRLEFRYASELIGTIRAHGGFDIAAACYPEGHPECDSLEQDVEHLRQKVEMGATHLITQLFFDNADFYRFLELVRKKGISVPIQAGIMPVVNKKQIERMVSMCGASIPASLSKIMNRYGASPEALRDAGINYAISQIIDLLSNSVEGIHLYTMNNPYVARKVSGSIASILECENG